MNNTEGQLTEANIIVIKAAEKAIQNELLLMKREGIPPMHLLVAMAIATTELITTTAGPEYVLPWFKNSAKLVENLQAQGIGL